MSCTGGSHNSLLRLSCQAHAVLTKPWYLSGHTRLFCRKLCVLAAEHRSRLCVGNHCDDVLPEGRLWCCGSGAQYLLAAPDPAVHLCVPPCHPFSQQPLHQAGQRLPAVWNSGLWHLLLLPHRCASPVSPECILMLLPHRCAPPLTPKQEVKLLPP